MTDYIDRQAALDAIQTEREYMTRREEWLAEHILTHCGYRIIADMQPADVEPVRHGYWQEEIGMIMCSECGDAWAMEQEEEARSFNYCPNCGARMDGEQDD